jgi:hypothetical protein
VEPLHAIDRPDLRSDPDELTPETNHSEALTAAFRDLEPPNIENKPVYAASRMSQLRTSSSAASQPNKATFASPFEGEETENKQEFRV